MLPSCSCRMGGTTFSSHAPPLPRHCPVFFAGGTRASRPALWCAASWRCRRVQRTAALETRRARHVQLQQGKVRSAGHVGSATGARAARTRSGYSTATPIPQQPKAVMLSPHLGSMWHRGVGFWSTATQSICWQISRFATTRGVLFPRQRKQSRTGPCVDGKCAPIP